MIQTLNMRDITSVCDEKKLLCKDKMIYRSACLDKVSRSHLEIIRKLDINSVIDLRSTYEILPRSDKRLNIKTFNIPIDIDRKTKKKLRPFLFKRKNHLKIQQIMEESYQEMVYLLLPNLSRLFEILSDSKIYPVLIHCQAGKDRTGLVCAILEKLLGFTDDEIMSDYLLTNANLINRYSSLITLFGLLSLGLLPSENIKSALTCRQEYLMSSMQEIESKYNGIDNYLVKGKVSEDLIDKFRMIMLKTR